MPKVTVHSGDTYEDGPRPPAESVYENPHDPLVQRAKRQADPPEDSRRERATVEVERERVKPSEDQVERASEGKPADHVREGMETSATREKGRKADEIDGPKDERGREFKLEGEDNAPTPDVTLTERVTDGDEVKKAPARPALNESKEAWVAYAKAVDPEANVELMTKASLIDKYGRA